MDIKILSNILDYDANSGVFTWKTGRGRYNGIKGKRAGSLRKDGYRQIKIEGKYHKEHRLAWYIVFGVMPKCEIDHINGNRADNSINNLREATKSENAHNRKVNDNSTTKIKGVSFHKLTGKYQATIMHKRISYYLGLYLTSADAENAVRTKREQLHGNYVNHG